MVILLTSPLRVAPYQTEEPEPTLTSPMTEALGATKTFLPSRGLRPVSSITVCARFTVCDER